MEKKQRIKLNTKEAAEYLGYTTKYIYKLVSLRKVPHHKPEGVRVYFFEDELEAHINRGRVLADYEAEESASNLYATMLSKGR